MPWNYIHEWIQLDMTSVLKHPLDLRGCRRTYATHDRKEAAHKRRPTIWKAYHCSSLVCRRDQHEGWYLLRCYIPNSWHEVLTTMSRHQHYWCWKSIRYGHSRRYYLFVIRYDLLKDVVYWTTDEEDYTTWLRTVRGLYRKGIWWASQGSRD